MQWRLCVGSNRPKGAIASVEWWPAAGRLTRPVSADVPRHWAQLSHESLSTREPQWLREHVTECEIGNS